MQEDTKQAVTHVLRLVSPTGAVPVRPVDRHSLLSAAPRSAAPQRGQRAGETTFPPNHRSRWSARSKERSHTLLDSGETQVQQFCRKEKRKKKDRRTHEADSMMKIYLLVLSQCQIFTTHFIHSFNLLKYVFLFQLRLYVPVWSISTHTTDKQTFSKSFFFLIFILPPAGRDWTWWEKCTTVLQSSPAVLWRTVTTLWPGATPSTTASPGSVLSAGPSPTKQQQEAIHLLPEAVLI